MKGQSKPLSQEGLIYLFCFLFYTFLRKPHIFSCSSKYLIQIHPPPKSLESTFKRLNIWTLFPPDQPPMYLFKSGTTSTYRKPSLLLVSASSPSFYGTYGSVGDTGNVSQGTEMVLFHPGRKWMRISAAGRNFSGFPAWKEASLQISQGLM